MSACLIWSTKTPEDRGPKLQKKRRYLYKTMQGDIRHNTGLRIGYNETAKQRMDVNEKQQFIFLR
jgi:hypothetical protein